MGEGTNYRNYTVDQIVQNIIPAVQQQWILANARFTPPVVVQPHTIARRIQDAWKRMRDIANSRCSTAQTDKFPDELDKLFDITLCRCQINTYSASGCDGCQQEVHVECTCAKEKKLPVLELSFIHERRAKSGQLSAQQIAGIDRRETRRQESMMKRRFEEERRQEAERKRIREQGLGGQEEDEGDDVEDLQLDSSHSADTSEPSSSRNMMTIANTTLASIRYVVSARATVAVASGFLKDLMGSGEINGEKSYLMVDCSKVFRAKAAIMKKCQRQHSQDDAVRCIYSDGRKDDKKGHSSR